MEKGEQQPLIYVEVVRQRSRRPWCKCSSVLAVALCVIVCLYAVPRIIGDGMSVWPVRCDRSREWTSRSDFYSLLADNGLVLEHKSEGGNARFSGHVNVMGTEEERIGITVDWRATDRALIEKSEVIVDGNHTVDGRASLRECAEFDVKLEVPSSTPFLDLTFITHSFRLMNSFTSDNTNMSISTRAGSIHSDAKHWKSEHTDINSGAGSINGHYILGNSMDLNTQAGSINVDIEVDTKIDSPKANLSTTSSSGSVTVDLLAPLEHRNRISGRHKTSTGSDRVSYPAEWEGVVVASTTAGSLKVEGEGLEIVESRGRGVVGRLEKGVKGEHPEKKSDVECWSYAGSVHFVLE